MIQHPLSNIAFGLTTCSFRPSFSQEFRTNKLLNIRPTAEQSIQLLLRYLSHLLILWLIYKHCPASLNTGNEFPNLAYPFTTALWKKSKSSVLCEILVEVSSHCYFWARGELQSNNLDTKRFFYTADMRTHFGSQPHCAIWRRFSCMNVHWCRLFSWPRGVLVLVFEFGTQRWFLILSVLTSAVDLVLLLCPIFGEYNIHHQVSFIKSRLTAMLFYPWFATLFSCNISSVAPT